LSQKNGNLHVAKEIKYDLKLISKNEFSFDNDSDDSQTFFVPARNYNLTDSISLDFLEVFQRPMSEKLTVL
jgi:hypothetical protein